MILNDVHRVLGALQLVDPDLVVQVASHVEEHFLCTASVIEVGEEVPQLIVDILIAKHQVDADALVFTEMINRNLGHNVALFHCTTTIAHLFVFFLSAFIVFSHEDDAFPFASRSDKHHVYDVLVLELLPM